MSVKVIENGTIRQIAYELLLAFHGNYGAFLYRFWDKARYWSKNRNFSRPLLHNNLLEQKRLRIAIFL